MPARTLRIMIRYKSRVKLLFDDNKLKKARKPEKKQKENPVGCTVEGKRGGKGYIREGKTGIVLELSLEVS